MRFNWANKIYASVIFVVLFTASSPPFPEQSKKFDLTAEEHLWLEKFFRYFMLHETAIYTLVGSKPLTKMVLLYEDKPEEQLREEKREEYLYFLLDKNNEKDMKFYEKLSPLEKKEKAYLVDSKDFIHNIEDLWDKWEKIQNRFHLKKRFLLVKKERPKDDWKDLFPSYTAIYDVFFVDILKTALVIQENYQLFRQAIGYDFDPLEVVFELENESSHFWDKIGRKDAWKYSYLWGLLFGFGKENSFSHFWKSRHLGTTSCNEKEKLLSTSIRKWISCKNRPTITDKNAFTLSNFTIPIFQSFSENDPIVAKYETEKENIKQLYKGKDFVTCTLELLTELPDTAPKQSS